MQKNTKKVLRLLGLFSPFLLFLFFLVMIGGVLGGSLSEEIDKNSNKIDKLVCANSKVVFASALKSENTTGHTLIGGVKIVHSGEVEVDSLILSVKIKADTEFSFHLVKSENHSEYQTISTVKGNYASGDELMTFTVSINAKLDSSNFVAIGATDIDGADIAWDIYTIAFISGGE